jgi:uncharacterized membrane protein YeaQ/YmgE (transglycosylase-associated protein family)
MGVLSWIVVGAIAGWLSGKVMKGGGFGLLGDIIVGVIGGIIGGWLAGALFNIKNVMTTLSFGSILVAFLGACLFLFIGRMIRGRGGNSLLHR